MEVLVWGNERTNATRYNVTMARFCRDGNDWKGSASFGRHDLLLLAREPIQRCPYLELRIARLNTVTRSGVLRGQVG